MSQVVPHRFLFRYSISIPRQARIPKKGGRLNLPQSCILPDLGELDDADSFGEIRMAWNPKGLGVSFHVSGKGEPLQCDAQEPTESDGLQIWIDTRNTQSIHRASRFCHHFCLLPQSGGKKSEQPLAVQLPIARAREEAPLCQPGDITVTTEPLQDGYRMEAWFPARILHGYDPEASPFIGFYYYLQDAELGEQFLTVDRQFPFAADPSLWVTLNLARNPRRKQ